MPLALPFGGANTWRGNPQAGFVASQTNWNPRNHGILLRTGQRLARVVHKGLVFLGAEFDALASKTTSIVFNILQDRRNLGLGLEIRRRRGHHGPLIDFRFQGHRAPKHFK